MAPRVPQAGTGAAFAANRIEIDVKRSKLHISSLNGCFRGASTVV
jgi:hypothetical protein